MTNIVYTAGYTGRKLAELVQQVQDLDALVFDVRHAPWSRNPDWSQKSLAAALGSRYLHVPSLGNLNYKNGGPVKLVDPDAGLKLIAAARRPVILLCACEKPAGCHRTFIAGLLPKTVEVAELARFGQPQRKEAQQHPLLPHGGGK